MSAGRDGADQAVTVVVPTRGRASLARAVRSVLAQVGVDVRVLVVDNSGDDRSLDLGDPRVTVLSSPPSLGANGARQRGLAAARTPLVALLDDDDVWLPDKLRTQLDLVEELGLDPEDDWVVTCGLYLVDAAGDRVRAPRRLSGGQIADVLEHLFVRDSLLDQRQGAQTSTLLLPRQTAERVPLRVGLALHQDWTWLIDLQRAGAEFYQAPDYLVEYSWDNPDGITAGSTSQASVAWSGEVLAGERPRVVGDFLLTVPFNMAVSSADTRAAAGILATAMRRARPGVPASTRAALRLAALVAAAGWRGVYAFLRERKAS